MSDLPEASEASREARRRVDQKLDELSRDLKFLVSCGAMGSQEIPLESQPEEIATLYEAVRARFEDTLQEAFRPHVRNVEIRCDINDIATDWKHRRFQRRRPISTRSV